jgi:hypothetical protein
MPRVEPRFYNCPARSLMTFLIDLPRLFTIVEELNKKMQKPYDRCGTRV